MKAIGYACMNTLSQQPKNFSLEEQESIVKKYTSEKGMTLVDFIKETTTSSNTQHQPMLQELIETANDGKFDTLVIARLDRLTRNVRQLNTLINEVCIKNKVTLISIDENLDTGSDCGKMALNIIDIVTKWDNKRISDRTREIIARKREKGERVGHAPFGYTYKNKRLVPVSKELDTVKLIVGQREGGLSYHKIAKYLNENSILSKRGGIWYAETVKTVFQNSSHPEKYIDSVPGE